MITIIDTSVLKKLLGDNIVSISSTALNVSEQSIKSLEINVLIAGKRNSTLFKCDYKVGFFENEAGDVYYDYSIETAVKNTPPQKSTVFFNTSDITQIEIFGRNFNANEFVNYPGIYNKVKGEEKTNDLFFFNCKKGERLMMVFHPYMPSIEVIYKETWIENFWSQYGSHYKLHSTIK